MATWKVISKFKGYRISPPFQIELGDYGALSKIIWEADIPDKTSLKIETSVSFDGIHWTNWKQATNGGAVQDIPADNSITGMQVRYKTILETNDKDKSPVLKSVVFVFQPVISMSNHGIRSIKPEIWITKIGNGDVSIFNTSNANQEFKFTQLLDGETVYINGEREYIETDLALTYRYDDFNDNYLELVRGENILRVVGEARVQFRYQWKLPKG